MDAREQELIRRLYDLHMQLYDHQTEEIGALRRSNRAIGQAIDELDQAFQSLQQSRDVLSEMLKVVGELVRPS